jgi:hypothetical protein
MNTGKSHSKFVLCVRPGESEDLEARKIYEVLPDQKAAWEGYLRVIDESGEDYLYPAEYFLPLKLPPAIVREFESHATAARRAPAVGR